MELIIAVMIFLGGQLYGTDDVQQNAARDGDQKGIVVPDPEEI